MLANTLSEQKVGFDREKERNLDFIQCSRPSECLVIKTGGSLSRMEQQVNFHSCSSSCLFQLAYHW